MKNDENDILDSDRKIAYTLRLKKIHIRYEKIDVQNSTTNSLTLYNPFVDSPNRIANAEPVTFCFSF